ncbi:MAG: NUDIX domain-containing protein [Candidatus Wolfebacteria bacterium]|nr:NUDIX domain-containing protein [Candidatus Wolfebacteria bacterium]
MEDSTIKIYYKVLKPVKKLYRFIFRPKTKGVKCVIECNGEILLIKNTYGHKSWTFPGGGVKKNETPEEALKRETKEEVGIKLNNIDFIGSFMANSQFKRDTVYCFTASVPNKHFKIDPIEISEARWFVVSELSQLKPNANRVLELYKSHR